MQKTFSLCVATSIALVSFAAPITLSSVAFAKVKNTMHPLPAIAIAPKPSPHPARLVIPAIGINAPIQGVGINPKGEMAVPDGASNAVGWYKYGTLPGEVGSAVLDAHVFAAFANLQYVKPGTDIYVINDDNSTLHFVVSTKKTYALGSLSPTLLFRPSQTPDLNLITCAGNLTKDHTTYDHRLIVYATLIPEHES